MREICRCLTLALVVLCSLSYFAPGIAWAQSVSTSSIPIGSNAPATSVDCPYQNQIDAAYFQMKASNLQKHLTTIQALNTMFPISPALTACVQNVMNVLQKLPALANPLGIATAVITALITSIITSTCSAIMGTITSIQTSLTNITKICLPLPHFNGLDLPQWNAPSCSGGLTISPISGWTNNPPLITTTVNPNLKQ